MFSQFTFSWHPSKVSLIMPFHRWGNWGLKRFDSCPAQGYSLSQIQIRVGPICPSFCPPGAPAFKKAELLPILGCLLLALSASALDFLPFPAELLRWAVLCLPPSSSSLPTARSVAQGVPSILTQWTQTLLSPLALPSAALLFVLLWHVRWSELPFLELFTILGFCSVTSPLSPLPDSSPGLPPIPRGLILTPQFLHS